MGADAVFCDSLRSFGPGELLCCAERPGPANIRHAPLTRADGSNANLIRKYDVQA